MNISRCIVVIVLMITLMFNPVFASGNKGKVYIYWGWNGSNYTKSDLHLQGTDYDFTIHKMRATDRQSPLSLDYINPTQMTIPQYNYRLGYFINDNISLSIGMDHMKYVMVKNQQARLSGNINNNGAPYKGALNGVYVISPDLLTFEHTDGLNNLNIEARWHEALYNWKLDAKGRGITFNVLGGVGAGALIPKTNATIFDKVRHDEFHLAGFDVHAVLGCKIDFWRYFFISSELKGGYINMPSIRISPSVADKASQSFGYIQYNILLGAQVKIVK